MPKNQFNTKFGVIAATVGSAVGLGNIWRFPYEAGVHGGGAFLLINLLCVLILGIPVMCAEFFIGRHTGCDVYGAFQKFGKGRFWHIVGWLGLLASFLILGFYSVVAGWTMEYIYQSLMGFDGAETSEQLHSLFSGFSSNPWQPLFWTFIFLAANYLILMRGIEKGIEKVSNILMPILFLILIAFTINSLTLPNAGEGLIFLFKPDFSAITPSVILGALGQAFFSLSLGMGCLITYASYFRRDTPLVRTAAISSFFDALVAIMAGVIIFPAVFTFGQEPAAGPQLVFEVLPAIFQNMAGGMIWSVLFFVLLFVASLTSTISVFEIIISYLVRTRGLGRVKAVTLTVACVIVTSSLCSLSFGELSNLKLFGLTIFNLFDYLSSNILLPLGGMLISIFVGWVIDRKLLVKELLGNSKYALSNDVVRLIIFSLRYIAPIGIAIVFIFGL